MAFITILSLNSIAQCSVGSLPYGKCGHIGIRGDTVPTCTSDGDLPYVVGWGHSCMVPAGAINKNDTSCITTPNLLGEVLDTITTVGIGIDMRANFCSVGKGGDPNMEGAFISKSYLDQCDSFSTKKGKKDCRNSLLRGINPFDGKHLTSRSSIIKTTTNLCNALPNKDRPVIDGDGKYVFVNNKQAFCPMMRCNIPTDTMISKYYDRMGPRTAIMSVFATPIGGVISALTGDCVDVVELGDGDKKGVGMWDIVRLKGDIEGDKICTKMLFPTGYSTLACKARSIPKTYYSETKNCYLKNSSCVTGELKSKSFFPLTAQIMECINDLVTNMFKTPENSECSQNPLAKFQETLKDIVRVMMILYVIVFGLRILMGGALPKKSEFFIFILKFALVTYFAVGTIPNADHKTGLEQAYEFATTAMSSFANIVAGNDDLGVDTEGNPIMGARLCQYNTGDYESGYEYLALWDSLDCKLAYYLSMASPLKGGGLEAVRGQFIHIGLFAIIWGAFFSFSIPLVIFLFAFGILLLSIIVYVAHIYIIALIAISITIFMGPIFIPMALFARTKGYFDEWLKLIISYTIYPTIVLAFVGIMVATFDQTLYPDCEFTLTPYGSTSYWEFTTEQSDTCKDAYGYTIAVLTSGSASEVVDFAGGLFQFSRLKSGDYMIEKLLSSLMMATFFVFLFYYFAKQLSAFAADVSMSVNLGSVAVSPTAVADMAIKIATKQGKKGGKGSAKGKGKDDKGISVAGEEGGKAGRSGIQVSGK